MANIQAKIGNYMVDCETITEGVTWALVKHPVLNQNGSDVESMGSDARTISVKTHWTGQNYNNHKDFLNDLFIDNEMLFDHPEHGTLLVKVGSVNILHDNGVDYCSIDLSLTEIGIPERIVYIPEIMNSIETDYTSQITMQTEKVRLSLVGIVGGALKKIERTVAALEALAAEVTLPAQSIVNAVTFATNLPGRLVKSLIYIAENYAQASTALQASPLAMLSALKTAYEQLAATYISQPIIYNQIVFGTAATLALHCGYAWNNDDTNRNINKQRHKNIAFAPDGTYLGNTTYQPCFNAFTIEQALYITRQHIQTALTIDHDNAILKQMADRLTRYARKIKLQVEKVITILISTPMPIHAVCRIYGLAPSYADDIVDLNGIKNPNAVIGWIKIYA